MYCKHSLTWVYDCHWQIFVDEWTNESINEAIDELKKTRSKYPTTFSLYHGISPDVRKKLDMMILRDADKKELTGVERRQYSR